MKEYGGGGGRRRRETERGRERKRQEGRETGRERERGKERERDGGEVGIKFEVKSVVFVSFHDHLTKLKPRVVISYCSIGVKTIKSTIISA
jgi:hypothetical protein